jgi:hypothetical protein
MTVYYWFWGLMTTAALIWYSTITVYIAFKGASDIRQMLQTLSIENDRSDAADS